MSGQLQLLNELKNCVAKLKIDTEVITTELEIVTKEFRAGRFVGVKLLNATLERLDRINKANGESRDKFAKLFGAADFPNTLDTLEDMVETAEKNIGAKQFLNLRTSKENILPLLQSEQDKLHELLSKNDALSSELRPYSIIVNAIKETDLTKKFEYTLELAKYFNRELASEAVFGQLYFEDSTEVEPSDVKPSDVEPTDVEPSDGVPSDVEPTDVEPTDVEPPKIGRFTQRLLDDSMLLPTDYDFGDFNVSETFSSGKKFSAGSFKNELSRFAFAEEAALILRYLYEYDYISLSMVEKTGEKDLGALNTAAKFLMVKGYIRECNFGERGKFYFAASGCKDVFDSREMCNNFEIKRKNISLLDANLEKSSTVMAARLAFAKIAAYIAADSCENVPAAKYKTQKRNKNTSPIKVLFLKEAFIVAEEAPENLMWQIVIGGFWTDIDESDRFFDALKKCLESRNVDNIVIAGADLQHAVKIKDAIDAAWEGSFIAGYKLRLYSLADDEFYLPDSSQPLDKKRFLDDDTDADGDTLSDVENDTSAEVEFKLEPQIIPELELDFDKNDDTTVEPVEEAGASKEDKIVEPTQRIFDKVDILGARYANVDDAALISTAYQMLVDGKIYCAVAYLKALSLARPHLEPVYLQLAAAVADPMLGRFPTYKLYDLIYKLDETELNEYLITASAVRCLIHDNTQNYYFVKQLRDGIKDFKCLFNKNPLSRIIQELINFKDGSPNGLDYYADYRRGDQERLNKLIATVVRDARDFKANNIDSHNTNRFNRQFLKATRKIFDVNGELAEHLNIVINNDYGLLELLKVYLLENFFMDRENALEERNFDQNKLMKAVNDACDSPEKLPNNLRSVIINNIKRAVEIMSNWLERAQELSVSHDNAGLIKYNRVRGSLLINIEEATAHLQSIGNKTVEDRGAAVALINTLEELRGRLDGSYQAGREKYFYVDFLRDNRVLLLENYLPDFERNYYTDGEDTSLLGRLAAHASANLMSLEERLTRIFEADDNFLFARMIDEYIAERDGRSIIANENFNVEECIEYGKRRAEDDRTKFIERLELAQCYGQIDNTQEDQKEKMLQLIDAWHAYALESNNFGVFRQVKDYWEKKIRADARRREKTLNGEIEVYRQRAANDGKLENLQTCFDKIKHMIEQQNYTAAEDGLRHLNNEDYWEAFADDDNEHDVLNDFLEHYKTSYDKVSKLGTTLQNQPNLKPTEKNREARGGQALIDNWIAHVGNQMRDDAGVIERLNKFLFRLGFNVNEINRLPVHGRSGTFDVKLKHKIGSSRSNYKHPIAAFGSIAEEKDLRVACIAGKCQPKELIDCFRELENAGNTNTLVLLDYSLTLAERHELAQLSKRNKSDSTVFGVIDRVLVAYLADKYNEANISRMLMQLMMPFAYCQPYVYASNNAMPPEIFIGRREELNSIKSPRGVNIVYGGRQLGKSALLKMAQMHVDHNENNDRALLVDINTLDYKGAALKISRELSRNFFNEPVETDNWDELTRAIRDRLSSEPRIPYFLLMLDEADKFIDSCKDIDYRPFINLNELQRFGTERFKFVIAGLRDVVRFNRKKALGDNSPLAHLKSMIVTPFKNIDAMRLMKEPLNYLGFRFPQTKENEYIIPTILATANYFPGLIQMYCAKLIEAMSRNDYAGYSRDDTPVYNISEEHFQKILGDADFREEVKRKFEITLEIDHDGAYYAIALIFAYLYYEKGLTGGYTPDEIIAVAVDFDLQKLVKLGENESEIMEEHRDRIRALLEELCDLNILRKTLEGKYLFNRYNFLQLMGNQTEVENKLLDAAIKSLTED